LVLASILYGLSKATAASAVAAGRTSSRTFEARGAVTKGKPVSDGRKESTRGGRTQDPEGTRADIIAIASEEFARNGLSGARIDEIAARTRASKRMIYYYFGDKEGLYLSSLENAYRVVREGEAGLDVEGFEPVEALRRLVEFTFDHHRRHEPFIRMVMIENIHHGEYLQRLQTNRELNSTAIATMESVYHRGLEARLFRDELDPVELHWQISALCFFNVSNRATFSQIFGRDFGSRKAQTALRRNVVDMVLRYVLKVKELPPDEGSPAVRDG
jgi:AcrR family transcriptional regulator